MGMAPPSESVDYRWQLRRGSDILIYVRKRKTGGYSTTAVVLFAKEIYGGGKRIR
jgi:hypothetical protein